MNKAGPLLPGAAQVEPVFVPQLMNDFPTTDRLAVAKCCDGRRPFGNLALLSLLAESGFAQVKPDPLAPSSRRAEGQAGNFSVHAWRAVARGHV